MSKLHRFIHSKLFFSLFLLQRAVIARDIVISFFRRLARSGGTLHSRIRANVGIRNEVINDLAPRRVVRDVVVVLWNHSFELRESGSRDKGKVMVLHMVANVEGESVQRSVVRVSLLPTEKHVMLADEVTRQGVKTHRQERAGNEVYQGLHAEEVKDGGVEGNLHDPVDDF